MRQSRGAGVLLGKTMIAATNEAGFVTDSVLAGDVISRTILRLGIGYGLYKTLMLWSVDLDDKFDVWKEVKPKRRKRK